MEVFEQKNGHYYIMLNLKTLQSGVGSRMLKMPKVFVPVSGVKVPTTGENGGEQTKIHTLP